MNELKKMPFWEHIEELRKHFFHCFFSVIIMTIFLMINKEFLFDKIIFAPSKVNFITYRLFSKFTKCKIGKYFGPIIFLSNNIEIQNRKIFGQFNTYINSCITGGCILSFPYFFYRFWLFISPALSKKEKQSSKKILFISLLLFIFGSSFGYFILCPFLINFGYYFKISNVPKNIFELSDYISLIIYTVFSMGIVFLLPLFIFILTKLGLISYTFLIKYRKHSLLIMLIFASAITPGDIISTIIVLIPLLILYQISIWISIPNKKDIFK